MSAWHRFDDHTSEVELTLEADTLPELFTEAARALATLLLGTADRPGAPRAATALRVAVQSSDLASLLVDWINELIYRTETAHMVFTEVDVVRLEEREIVADLRGLAEPELAGEVKAATLHQAQVAAAGTRFRGHVILDV
jgi:SHS2 domain-containing protein